MKSLLCVIGAVAVAQFAQATEISVKFANTAGFEGASALTKAELGQVTKEVSRDIEKALKREGAAPARVDITIVDVKANRPTSKQVRMTPGLDQFRSVSLGGMALEGVAYDASGDVVATYEYSWYERNIGNTFGSGQWSDAFRASDRFARRFADKL